MISTFTIRKFLECPKKLALTTRAGFIPLTEFRQWAKQVAFFGGIQWILIYKGATGKIPSLLHQISNYRDRAWASMPKTVTPFLKPQAREVRKNRPHESRAVYDTIRKYVRGEILASRLRYTIPELGVYGVIDLILKDGAGKIHLYKLSFGAESDKWSNLIYLDVLGFQIIHGVTPDYIWYLDLENVTRYRMENEPKCDIIKEFGPLVKAIESGASWKTPGAHCSTCPFDNFCRTRR